MSVDDTIRELSHTLAKLGELVMEINGQVGSISSRINITLQTFDDSISGIAKDANKMTSQVDTTIAQIPGSWAFYLLFFTMIAVLILLSALLLINLLIKVRSLLRVSQIEILKHIAVEMEHEPRRYGFGPQQSRVPSGYSSASASAFHQPPPSNTEYFANGNGIRAGGTCSPSICDIRGRSGSPRSHQGSLDGLHPKCLTTKKRKMLL
uniref:Plasma membrane fusion protein PRM1 n=1 Tax=Meloidogyne hapla TaxID=6305 RepID=A0A1I8B395_MELHA